MMHVRLTSGGYSAGGPPLPIPNREVKPDHADGTAHKVGEQVAAVFDEAVFGSFLKTAFFYIIRLLFNIFAYKSILYTEYFVTLQLELLM